jgi:hypothetical protein
VVLKRLMRADGDEAFIAGQKHMRRVDVAQPVTDAFVERLHTVSAADLGSDERWRFAPIGVLSRLERDAINYAQLKAFAQAFGLPLVRWRLQLSDPDALRALGDNLDELYEEESGLWSYFVEGAPLNLTQTIMATRKLVNGSPGLADSLTFRDGVVPAALAAAYDLRTYALVTLDEPPLSVNVLVGSKKGGARQPALWHGVPLDDLHGLIEPFGGGDAQVVPLLVDSFSDVVDLRSVFAAQTRAPVVVFVKQHKYRFAFALTDYKLQGRTLPKLILSICRRPVPPWLKMCDFYVLISRVRSYDGLRLLQRDKWALDKVTTMQHDQFLAAWEQGYDSDGMWSDSLVVEGLEQVRSKRRADTAAAAAAKQEKQAAASKSRAEAKKAAAAAASKSRAEAKKAGKAAAAEMARPPGGAVKKAAPAQPRGGDGNPAAAKRGASRPPLVESSGSVANKKRRHCSECKSVEHTIDTCPDARKRRRLSSASGAAHAKENCEFAGPSGVRQTPMPAKGVGRQTTKKRPAPGARPGLLQRPSSRHLAALGLPRGDELTALHGAVRPDWLRDGLAGLNLQARIIDFYVGGRMANAHVRAFLEFLGFQVNVDHSETQSGLSCGHIATKAALACEEDIQAPVCTQPFASQNQAWVEEGNAILLEHYRQVVATAEGRRAESPSTFPAHKALQLNDDRRRLQQYSMAVRQRVSIMMQNDEVFVLEHAYKQKTASQQSFLCDVNTLDNTLLTIARGLHELITTGALPRGQGSSLTRRLYISNTGYASLDPNAPSGVHWFTIAVSMEKVASPAA